MKRYRKKPVVIEAEQFFYGKKPWLPCIREIIGTKLGYMTSDKMQYIRTLEGDMIVNKGDWIIKGVKGEFYPCKPDIFEQTYTEVDNEKEKE